MEEPRLWQCRSCGRSGPLPSKNPFAIEARVRSIHREANELCALTLYLEIQVEMNGKMKWMLLSRIANSWGLALSQSQTT